MKKMVFILHIAITVIMSSYGQTSSSLSNPTVTLAADVTNNNAVANTLQDVTGLSFNVTANQTYWFRFFIVYTSAATTTGSRWTINGPAQSFLTYRSQYTLTATSLTFNEGLSAYNNPSTSNASSLTGSNIAIVEGTITPTVGGVVVCRFASEVAGSAIIARSKSFVEFKITR